MRLEVTLCREIIEQCLNNLDIISRENIGKKILHEIYKRKICLSEGLENHYLSYFENEKPDLLYIYHDLMAELLTYEDNVKIISEFESNIDIFENGCERTTGLDIEYLQSLVDTCYNSNDKIIISNILESYNNKLENKGISIINLEGIVNYSENNVLNSYRLPIIRKRIRASQQNSELSNWLKRFILDTSKLIIIDGYIYENSEQFLKYFLCHVPYGVSIRLYTLLNNGNTENEIRRKFTTGVYGSWSIEIFIISDKKEQHARNIYTDKYFISIDRGMGVFGRNGQTLQTDIAIDYHENIDRIDSLNMPSSRKIS